MEVNVYVGTKHWDRKPESSEIGVESKQLMLNGCQKMDLLEYAKLISQNGVTSMLAQYPDNGLDRRKAREILSQDLVMLDFDNNDSDTSNHYSIEDFRRDEFMRDHAAFVYRTFSDEHSDVDKFRVVFRLDYPATSNDEVRLIYEDLLKKYPQSDSVICQPNRLFFGSDRGPTEIAMTNTLLNIVYHNKSENQTVSTNHRNDSISILNNTKVLKASQAKITFADRKSTYAYFRGLDIHTVFNLPEDTSFHDILHEESNPSARIYRLNASSPYRYKCFSDSARFDGDLIELISRLMKFTPEESFDYLCDVYNVEVTYTSELGMFEKHWFDFIEKIKDESLKEDYPYLAKYLHYYNSMLCSLLPRLLDYTRSFQGKVTYMNYHSNESLAKALLKSEGISISESRVRWLMTTLTVLEIYSKKASRWELRVSDNDSKYKNYIIPNELNEINLNISEGIAKRLIEANIAKRSLSYETVYREFGEEKAKRDFNQIEAHLKTMKKSKVDRNLSSKSVSSERATIKELSKYFEENNYISEKELIRLASRRLRKKKIDFEGEYKKFRASILTNYGYERVPLNKELHTRLGLEGKCSREIVIIKTNYEE